MFFGGLPLNNDKATIVVERTPFLGTSQMNRPKQAKRFSTDAFLDLYLMEKNKSLATFEEVQQQLTREKETQSQLKQVLGIRTFDQIQADLSNRLDNDIKLQEEPD